MRYKQKHWWWGGHGGEEKHLPIEEDVTIQVEGWIESGTNNDLDTKTIYDNVVEHIELQFMKRPLTYLEKACVEKQ